MNCDKCNDLINQEDSKCNNCGTEIKHNSYIKVMETADKPLITIIKSVLTDAKIEFFVNGEGLQDIIGIGNLVIGPMELYVQEEDAEAVKLLIQEMEMSDEEYEEF